LDRPPVQRVINEGNRYAVPRDDGRVLVGSSEEEVGFVKETTKPVIDDLSAWACTWIPKLKEARIEKTWAGFRPASIDGLPYIGPVPSLNNTFVATGHYRHGLHLSPGTAKLVFEMIQGIAPSIQTEAFRLIRGNTST
jgi:glycine oxidase